MHSFVTIVGGLTPRLLGRRVTNCVLERILALSNEVSPFKIRYPARLLGRRISGDVFRSGSRHVLVYLREKCHRNEGSASAKSPKAVRTRPVVSTSEERLTAFSHQPLARVLSTVR